jgi:AcrR family transcriptional regulator
VRLNRADRRDALLDAAVALVAAGDVEAVSMEAVAERAGVSRPLVYKHFANRNDLLVGVYRREAALLHREMAAQVSAATSLEAMFRALVRGALRAAADRGHVFAVLRSAGGWSRDVRHEQRARDAGTVRAFSARAVEEYHLDRPTARASMAILLDAVDSVLAQWRRRPTPEHAQLLEDTYMNVVAGALTALRRNGPAS